MTRLEQLVAGAEVEWRTLGEVATLRRGRVILKKRIAGNEGPYPVYGSQTVNEGEIGRIGTYDFDQEALTWTTDGARAGTVFYRNGRFSISHLCGLITIADREQLDYKYLYHWLSIEAQSHVNAGMGISQMMIHQLAKIPVPIPPLAIQVEIAHILDVFMKSEAELEHELARELSARRKQYAYYRDRLLTFGEDEVEWKTLGEVGTFYGGLSGKTRKDFAHGSAAYIPYRNIFGNPELDPCWLETVDVADSERQHAVQYGDVLFTASSETADEVGMSSVVTTHFARPVYLNSFSFGFRFHAGVKILPAFSKHLFRGQALRRVIVKTANGTIRYNVSRARFSNIMIPLPSLAMQTEIAEVLDRLHALSHSLMDGLPAELRARRKQYEHYRERLLTFPGAPDSKRPCVQFAKK